MLRAVRRSASEYRAKVRLSPGFAVAKARHVSLLPRTRYAILWFVQVAVGLLLVVSYLSRCLLPDAPHKFPMLLLLTFIAGIGCAMVFLLKMLGVLWDAWREYWLLRYGDMVQAVVVRMEPAWGNAQVTYALTALDSPVGSRWVPIDDPRLSDLQVGSLLTLLWQGQTKHWTPYFTLQYVRAEDS